ncbi:MULTISPECIES: hypothetical protein [unclassified Rhizobium]|uniref:hypothetical protein n=1 Tax=unclassified Rhizobium TaxID=2613769 RepID=UPI0007014BC0|nr:MULTISPECIES: hypothetical protein [unclassified Rhizobium]KQV42553.1 hypothetical protein ASC86_19680 [Rhizobium sp. Root1212]KRD21417.1 hypothetical protein ASE37_17915 [Rhizobium sp. Root268]
MDVFRLSYPACVIAGKVRLTARDIDVLRDHVFTGGMTTSQDAVILLAINRSSTEKCPEWQPYFIETMTDFIVRHCYPQGAMDEWNAEWLIAMISTRGIVNSRIERDLLFHIIDTAARIPDSLSIFALEQIRLALSHEACPAEHGAPERRLTMEDVRLVCRVMAAIARSRGVNLTDREARMLRQVGILIGLGGQGEKAA